MGLIHSRTGACGRGSCVSRLANCCWDDDQNEIMCCKLPAALLHDPLICAHMCMSGFTLMTYCSDATSGNNGVVDDEGDVHVQVAPVCA